MKMTEIFDNANGDTRVRILLGIRQVEGGKQSVDIVNARLSEVKSDDITLTVTHEISSGDVKTFQCRFNRSCFYIERFNKHDNRIDVQVKDDFELTEYQEKWLEKNFDWSVL